jgi:hypothetical protein
MSAEVHSDYEAFLERKAQADTFAGFEPVIMPDFLFDFQKSLVDWAVRKGKAAIFADCGLGKTPMQLVWAQNIVERTNGNVLILTPLAVGHQTIREGEKFGIACRRSFDGKPVGKITVANYERLHHFDPTDFVGAVCDESSILKNFDGKRRALITEFMRRMDYRLLCTATAAPNDYVELGTSSEALGSLGYMDMLTRFFRNVDASTVSKGHQFRFKIKEREDAFRGRASFWRFKRHAQQAFWRWVCSWARALRRPSDLGFDDDGFVLPELIERESVIDNAKPLPGELFVRPALGLKEQREERRLTLCERCEKAAKLVEHGEPAVLWCYLNDEGDLLEKLIPDAVQVSGSDSDERKEEVFVGFSSGQVRVLVTKPKIGGFGLNWQHCAHVTFFPSHSYEQYYQGVRRCWRFGQTRPVVVDVISTGGDADVLRNLKRKAEQADQMFTNLVTYMGEELRIARSSDFTLEEEVPAWLSAT